MNRAAKHGYEKQRCKTSDNRHFQMKNMNLQFRSMCATEPTSAELTSSRRRFAKRPFHQWNTQSSNPTLSKRTAPETRTPNDTRTRSRRTAPQENGDNSPEHGGIPKPSGETTEKDRTHPFLMKDTTLQRSSTARVHAQSHSHNVGFFLRVVSSTHHVPKKSEQSTCAL